MFPYFKKQLFLYIVLFILMFVGIAVGLISAWYMQKITDAALSGEKSNVTTYFLFGIVFIAVLMLTFFFNIYLSAIVTNKIKFQLKVDLHQHMLRLPTNYMQKHHSGNLSSVINQDLQQIDGVIGLNILNLLRIPITAIVAFIYLVSLNWQLACFILVIGPFTIFLTRAFGKSIRENSQAVQAGLGKSNEKLNETLNGHTTIRIYGLEARVSQLFHSINKHILKLQIKDGKLQGLLHALTVTLGYSTQILIMGIGAFLVVDNQLSIGDLLAFIILSQHIVSPFSELGHVWGEYQKSMAAIDRIFQVLVTKVLPVTATTKLSSDQHNLKHAIRMENVNYSYSSDKYILKDINLTINPGDKVAIVGPSGAGKSTLLHLLGGLYFVNDGHISINNERLNEQTAYELRQYLAIVTQDTFLFHGTIKDNLLVVAPEATEDQMMHAAKAAYAHDFIMSLPEGYDTHIGEKGASLSGGQRQRISIARAILRNAPILLLDEATSSLDSDSEKEIQKALTQLLHNKTSITIAHRLSTIINSDIIYVMEDGEIKEKGSHEELLSSNGLYARLFHLQFNSHADVLTHQGTYA